MQNLLQTSYSSESESDSEPLSKKPKLSSAEPISTALNPAPQTLQPTLHSHIPTSTTLTHNMPLAHLNAPIQGPLNPFSVKQAVRNVMGGWVDEHYGDNGLFEEMKRTFDTHGYTVDPEGAGEIVGDKDAAEAHKGATIGDIKKVVMERHDEGQVDDTENYLGPWAPYKTDDYPFLEPSNSGYVPVSFFDKDKLDESGAEKILKETSIMHGEEVRDYLGRGFLYPPDETGVDFKGSVGEMENFIPKSLVHTWTGHTKPVTVIRLFPKTGHLLLSGSMDTKIKIWDVYRNREPKRTYIGHTKGIKDLCFNSDGSQFLSCSYDKWIKLWDTETGECITRINCKKIPYCVKFNPNPEKESQFLVGSQDKKIYQYDVRSGEVVQTYDQHSGAVNTINFLDDEGKRFVSTSDDKTLRQWKWDVPVVVKFVSEPSMYSIPASSLSHDKKWLACQSLDNKIAIYSVADRIKVNRRKLFDGHLVAGYSCRPDFSPDGRFVMSGDSEGKMWFWDWKTCKVYKKFKAHDGPVVSCLWNPHESSKVITCGNDGNIKYWD